MTDANANQTNQIGLGLWTSSTDLFFDTRSEGITGFIPGFVINVMARITILNATNR